MDSGHGDLLYQNFRTFIMYINDCLLRCVQVCYSSLVDPRFSQTEIVMRLT
jgi:hypothetical protein